MIAMTTSNSISVNPFWRWTRKFDGRANMTTISWQKTLQRASAGLPIFCGELRLVLLKLARMNAGFSKKPTNKHLKKTRGGNKSCDGSNTKTNDTVSMFF
jgi:hypothetical protein